MIGQIAMQKIFTLTAALLLSASAASAQVELKTYANADGYIDVQKLTCGQLANTYQEDADFLGIWYSGWYNGLAKKHAINVPRVKEGIHNVIVYCKANRGKLVIQAIDVILKREQQQKR
jgi:inactivated superfamily I helicase